MRKKSRLLFGIALAGGLLYLLFYWLPVRFLFRGTVTTPDLAQIRRLTGLSFPRGARLTNSWRRVFLDDIVLAKLTMPRGDLDAFLHDNTLQASRPPLEKCTFTNDSVPRPPEWWMPDALTPCLCASRKSTTSTRTGTEVVTVRAAAGHPEDAAGTLYILWNRF